MPLLRLSLLALVLLSPLAAQSTLYWDSDGATPGTTNIRNTWDYSAIRPWWSTSAAGDTATQAWTSGSTAVFSAGTNATGYQLVDIGQGVNVAAIYVEEGDVELWGAFYSGYFHDLATFDVASGASAILDATMNESSGAVNFTKTGAGTLTIKAPNNMTGNFAVSGGTVNITSQSNLSSGNLTVSNGATLANNGILELNNRTVSVTGAGSTLSSTNYIELGDIGDVTTSVHDGAVIRSDSSIAFGVNAGVNGVGLVSGSGSQLNSGSQIHVGYHGIGELTVESGGTVTPGSILELATAAGSTGTFNLNAGGTLAVGGTQGIAKGAGTANFNFGGGTLEVTGANLTTLVPVTLVSGTDSTIDTNGFTAALSGGVSGAGSLTKSGTGSLYLYGASYTGSTTIDEGTLYNTLNNLPSGTALTINSPGTFDLAGYAQTVGSLAGSGNLILGGVNLTTGGANTDTAFSGVISGTGTFSKTGTGTLTLSGDNTYTGITTISGGSLQIGSGSTTGALASSAITNNANLTFNRSNALSYAGVISGSGSVTQNGTGNTTLSGSNTYSGGTTVNAGTLTLGHANALGATTGNLTLNGGSLDLGTFDPTVGTAIFNGGTFTNGTLDNAAAFEVRTGSLPNDLDGAQTLTKTGSGTFTLSGTNTYTGDTTVSGGTLQVSSAGNIGSGDLHISGGSLSSSGNLVLNRAVTVDGSGSALSTTTYLEIGDGATGSLTVSDGGAVTSGTTAAIGHQAGVTGTATLTGSGSSLTSGDATYLGISGSGTLNLEDGASLNAPRVILGTYFGATGNLNINGGTLNVPILTIGESGVGNLNINDGGSISNTSITAGYSGRINVNNGGILNLSSSNGVEIQPGGSPVYLNQGGTIQASGVNPSFGGSNLHVFGGTLQVVDANLSSGVNFIIGDAGTWWTDLNEGLTVDTNGFDATLTGTLTRVFPGRANLTKTGEGTLTLTAANTYAGSTHIQGGTLSIASQSNLSTGGIFIQTGGRLTSSGSLPFDRRVSVTGAGSSLYTSGYLEFGTVETTGSGSLYLYDGATAEAASTVAFGTASDALGIAEISGTGSTLTSGAELYLGISGSATVDVSSGGVINAPHVLLAIQSGSVGILNLHSGGTVNIGAGGVDIGSGSGSALNLRGGTVNFTAADSYSNAPFGVVTGTTSTLNTNAFDATIGGVLAGGGSLIKTGSGTLTLTGANTYTGTTTLSGGTLQIGAGGSTGALASDVVNNANLAFNRSDALAYSGVISGSGSVTQVGTGNTTLSGNNTYTGGTIVDAGTLTLGHANALGATTGNLTLNGGTLDLGTNSPTIGTAIFNGGSFTNGSLNNAAAFEARTGSLDASLGGSSGLTKTGSGTFVFTGDQTYTGTTTVSEGTLQIGDGGTTGSIASSSIVNNANLAFNRSNAVTAANNISGSGSVTQSGSGTLTLSGTNTYSGGTTVSGGTLAISSDAKLGASSGALAVTNGATLNTGGDFRTNRAVTIDGSGSNLYNNGELIIGNGGTGSLTLTDGGSASAYNLTLAFGGGTGSVNIGDGSSVTVGNATSLGSATSNITLGNGGTLTTTTLGGTGTFDFAGGTLVAAGEFTSGLSGTLTNASTVNTNGHATTLSGNLSGTGALTKSGSGTLTLSGTNTYSGGTTVSGGTLAISSDAKLGASSGALAVTNGATLNTGGDFRTNRAVTIDGSGSNLYNNGELIIGNGGTGSLTLTDGATASTYNLTLAFGGGTGSVNIGDGSSVTVGNTTSLGSATSNITLGNGGTLTTANLGGTGTFDFAGGTLVAGGAFTSGMSGSVTNASTVNTNGHATTLSGNLSGTGSLTKSGTGTLTLTGSNSYSGGTTVSAGTLTGNTTSLQGNIVNNSAVTFDQSTTGTYAGDLSGSGSLTKSGAGNLTLSGTNTYAGGTTVSGGTLTIASDAKLGSSSGALAVSNGATLATGGDFRTNRAVTIDGAGSNLANNGELIIGNNGTGSLALTNNATVSAYNLHLAYTGGTGTVDIGSGASINVSGTTSLWTGSSALNLNDGGTLTTPGLSGSGTLNLAGGTLRSGGALSTGLATTLSNASTVDTNGYATTLSGVLSGDGSLTKSGTGTLTLTGANTYSGGTTVSAGTLTGNTSSLQGDITNNSAVVFDQAATGTYAGTIDGTGSLTKSGVGNLTLTGSNSHSGGTTVSGGSLTISSDAKLGASSGALAVTNGATLATGGDFRTNRAVTIDGSGSYLANNGELIIGNGGNGSLTLTDGGTASTYNLTLAFGGGTGTVDIGNGSSVSVGNITALGSGTSSVTVGNGGTLTTAGLSGSGTLHLAGGTLRSGGAFSSNVATTLTGSSTVDTNGHATTLSGSLSGTGSLTKSGAGTLTLSGSNGYTGTTSVSAGTLALTSTTASPTINLASGATLEVSVASGTRDNTDATTFTGSGTLQKTGAGNAVWGTAAATFAMDSGALIDVQAGTLTGGAGGNENWTANLAELNVASGATFAGVEANVRVDALSGAGTITSGYNGAGYSTFTFGVDDGSGTFSGVLADTDGSNAGHFTKVGSGTQILTGANTYTGGTTVSGGTLQLGNGAATGSVTGDIVNNAAVVFDRTGDVTYTGVISGTGNVTHDGSILRLDSAQTYTGSTTVKSGSILVLSTDTDQGLSAATDVELESGAILDISNRATEIAGLTGTGRIYSFGGSNGQLTVNTADGQDQTFSGVLGGNNYANFALTKAGAGTLTLTGANTHTGGTTVSGGTLSGNTTSLQGNITNNAALVFNQDSAGTYAGTLSGSGSLSKTGAGTLILSGTSDFTGTTTVNAGSLRLDSASALGATASVDVAAGATLDLNGNSVTIADLDGAGNITLGSGTLTTGDGANHTLSGVLSGTGGLTKTGSGTLTLSGTNTYSGGTTLNGGTVAVHHLTNLGSGDITINTGALAATGNYVFENDTVVTGSGSTLTTSGYVEWGTNGTGSLTVANGAQVTSGATTAFGNQAAGNGSATVTGTGSTLTSTGALYVGISGSAALTIADGGTVTAPAVFAGVYGTSSGTLNLNAGGKLQTSVIASEADTATFNFNGGELEIINANFSSGETFTLGDSTSTTIDTNGFAAAFTGTLEGSGGFTKAGVGTMTLSGTNTYTGATTINAGTLALGANGSIANSSGVALGNGGILDLTAKSTGFAFGSGQTLSGSGTLNLATNQTLNFAGTLAPGNSPGIITVDGNLVLNSAAIVAMELAGSGGMAGTDFDQIIVNGDLTLGGTLQLTLLNDYTPSIGQSFQLFTASSIGGTFANYDLPTIAGATWNTSYLAQTGAISLSAVPEPGTYAALAGLAMLGYAAWRKRRRTTK
ncbi:autotransporter-associated beta strand repeat-containing protein [Actomonas aquatica]|uniref:Autotransporter-associated beta strand repeat-containing protein n=1 Tax=Actomonas aquatica TaxID=2866162 RepID=A0ABZ1C9I9_9BACT|nr:autotransporter-associated beta strand repeat-containing protein [Opitutus sp. WL0086]WRQ86985.1 autotransporter-associated beta strand repeat-containing protein [Opitutus sp. WL0086]